MTNAISATATRPSSRFRMQPTVPAAAGNIPDGTLDLFRQDAFQLTQQVRNQEIHRTLFSATMQLSHGGVPGMAGVALAKVVTHALEQSPGAGPDDQAELVNSTLDLLQYSQEGPVAPLARKAFDQARSLTDLQQADGIKSASLKRIAQLEGWNILA